MPRQNQTVENLLLLGKIRKRGCSSPTSSTSSVLREGYRFKRAIVVGKRGGSTTPVPTWRLMGRSPSPAASPSQCGSKTGRGAPAAPVSARKLAATLWEMNEMPSSPRGVEEATSRKVRKERIAPLPPPPPPRSVRSGSLPPHLSDPSHSPVSEVKLLFLLAQLERILATSHCVRGPWFEWPKLILNVVVEPSSLILFDWWGGKGMCFDSVLLLAPCDFVLTDQRREREREKLICFDKRSQLW